MGEDDSPVASSSSLDRGAPKRKTRSKSGCLTCRLRKKRCDEGRPTCATCNRLGLECLGYEAKRPEWMAKREVVTNVISTMKKSMAEAHSAKRRQRWSEVAAIKLGGPHDVSPSPAASGSWMVDDESPSPTLATAASAAADTVPIASSSMSPDRRPTLPAQPGRDRLEDELNDLFAYPVPQGEMVDDLLSPIAHDGSYGSSTSTMLLRRTSPPPIDTAPSSPLVDPNVISLLGFDPSSPLATQLVAPVPYLPLLSQPSAIFHTTFASTSVQMRYFNHYLKVIMPYQWIFERRALSDLVTPLAFANPLVFNSVNALAALHMGSKRHRRRRQIADTPWLAPVTDDVEDPDLAVAETTLQRSLAMLKTIPFNELGSHEIIVAAMSTSSFHLFDGGNRRGWKEAVALCRKSLAAMIQRSLALATDGSVQLKLPDLLKRMGHLLAPLVWTDILTSVTEGVASQFMPLYRSLLLDDDKDGDVGALLQETVMGCDSTTRLVIAETIALSEWKEKEERAGRLSIRTLLERGRVIEDLAAQRSWREKHLLDNTESASQRRAVSEVFFHGARVLLATTLNGPYPAVPEVASAVTDTADAFCALDQLQLTGADRALVFPTVMAGCHAHTPEMQAFFKDRFERLGEEAASFGNTQNALRLMEEVWRRRAAVPVDTAVHWRKVMFELDDEGMLLI